MPRKRHTPEQIIDVMREAENLDAQGTTVAEVCRLLGVTEKAYYRWRNEYGGMTVNRANRLKKLEQENARLRKAVVDLALDEPILQETAEGNFRPLPATQARRRRFTKGSLGSSW